MHIPLGTYLQSSLADPRAVRWYRTLQISNEIVLLGINRRVRDAADDRGIKAEGNGYNVSEVS